MSLLMDALRKAEADKKQGSVDENAKLALTSEPPPGTPSGPPSDDSDPSINVSFAETVDLRRATRNIPPAPPPPPEPNAELTLEPLAYTELLEPAPSADPATPEPPAPTNRTSTLPSMRGVEQQLDDYFDDSQAPTVTGGSNIDPLDAMMAEPVSTRESGITETVASAATVFEAGTGGPSRRVIAWGIIGAAVIGTLLIGAGFYYFQQAPATLALPSPSVAINVEKPLPRELPVVPVTGPLPTTPGTVIEPVVRVEPDDVPRLIADRDPPVVANPEPAANLIAIAPDSPAPQIDARDAVAPSAPINPVSPLASPAPASVPSAAGLSLGQLRIARSGAKSQTDPLLNDAYAAYVTGDYVAAERGYAAVLERQPERRDALLGMAALKLRDGNVAAAHRMYRDVLKRDPGNATAQAALFSLERGGADNVTEAKLKLLLDEGVDSGYIYFSLGNLYAGKQRWPDAQQAYFEALRYHPTNPDYNYNLAVSLDRIGQRGTAAKYYEAAVDLTDSERAGFDPAQALARLQAIAGTGAE
jgi:tetratricopeptide (TPR) repeat protein